MYIYTYIVSSWSHSSEWLVYQLILEHVKYLKIACK